MKRLMIVVAALLFIAFLMSACHSSKHCPAYSKVETEQTETNS